MTHPEASRSLAFLLLWCVAAAALGCTGSSPPPKPPKVDPIVEAGKDLYRKLGCPKCHQVEGKGGVKGPVLDDGTRLDRSRAWLRNYLIDPPGTLNGSKMPPVDATPAELDPLIDYLRTL